MAEMVITVGSKNPAKVEAVRESFADYPHLASGEVVGVEVSSDVADQPRSLEEVTTGAMNRARNAFGECTYSVGIESGIMAVPHTKSGYMDVCCAAIFDGSEYHLGLSSAFEFPNPEVMRLIMEEGLDMSEAVNKMGMTNNPNIGSHEGAIGVLTKGRMDRKAYTKQALMTALIHLEPAI